MRNIYILIVVVIIFVIGISALLFNRQIRIEPPAGSFGVATSFYPLYFFTTEIGKDMITVTNLTPAGAEPHDFEPNTQDIVNLVRNKLFIINGAGFEPWVAKVKDELDRTNIKILPVAEGIASQEIEEEGVSNKDPHIWLDPILAGEEADKIADALSEIDPTHTDVYRSNNQRLQEKFQALDTQYKITLQNCAQKSVITSHAAFGYLAKRYGFTQVSLSGLSPDEEPSPHKLAEFADLAKRNGIKYIFFETLVSPRIAETLANEIGAKAVVFDPIEGLTPENKIAGKDYFSIQQDNLKQLSVALNCKR